MSASVSIEATKVTFHNQFTSMAGSLFVPPNMDKTKKYKALVVAHPFGGVKEQTAGTYARKMAEKGYVTLAFDASHQGESGGYPRDTENPAERIIRTPSSRSTAACCSTTIAASSAACSIAATFPSVWRSSARNRWRSPSTHFQPRSGAARRASRPCC
jgi:dienelactone hydrolase